MRVMMRWLVLVLVLVMMVCVRVTVVVVVEEEETTRLLRVLLGVYVGSGSGGERWVVSSSSGFLLGGGFIFSPKQ